MNSKPDWIGGHIERSEIMDFMDIDQVVEVPDTPDRLLAACSSGDSNKIQNASDISKNHQVVNEPRQKGKSVTINGNRRLFVRPDNSSNSSGSLSNNIPAAVDNARHDKGKALCNSTIQKCSSFVDLTDQNGRKKCLFSANGLNAVDTSSKSCRLNGNLKIGERKGERNLSPSVTRQKRSVRNGCISLHNMAKSKQVVEKHGTSAMALDGSSSRVDIKDLIAEAKESRRFKGKGVSHSHHPSSPDARSRHLSQRNSVILKEPTDASKDIESDGWRARNNPTRKPDLPLLDNDSRIFRGKGASSSAIDHQKNGSTSSNLNNHFDDLEIVSSQRVSAPPETVSRRAHQLGQFKERAQLTKRQREGVASSNTGMPRFNDSEIVFLSPSSEEPSTSRPTRNKNRRGAGASNPVIALDESSPDAGNHGLSTCHSSNEGSGVRALQLEADEMLARELQERLYNEELGIDEMDSHHALEMAMALLQENGSHTLRARGRPAHRPASRGASVSNLYQHSRSNPSRNPSVHRGGHAQAPPPTRLARLRGRFPGRPRTLSSTTMTRNSIFPPNMDVDMRMQILEALEAFNDMELPNDLLQVGREFNENDYEILLALDENNHQHGGATHAQINNLPESMVQAENLQECAICLETPSIGETIRHLPCLHRFHKDCIDEWLRRKTSCPICKSSVT